MRFPSHTPDTAAGKAADLLRVIIERHVSAGTMARSALTRNTHTVAGTALAQV